MKIYLPSGVWRHSQRDGPEAGGFGDPSLSLRKPYTFCPKGESGGEGEASDQSSFMACSSCRRMGDVEGPGTGEDIGRMVEDSSADSMSSSKTERKKSCRTTLSSDCGEGKYSAYGLEC